MFRRWGTAFALSVAAHLVVAGGVVTVMVLNGLSSFSVPIDVDIAGMRMDEVQDLPLGPPPGGAEPAPGQARPRLRRRAPRAPAADGELARADPSRDDKAGAPGEPEETPEAAPLRASNLREYGPEGSRFTALLRLDRLRGTSYAPALDALLGRLPDRRDLLDGTGLDLFETFDALLIATPNPLDYTVTFLAARHRLKDSELRAALDRGAKATDRVLTWRTEGRRPFAERHARRPAPVASRDERLVVMPAPGLVVVTPPVYRSLLLSFATRPRAPGAAAAGGGRDGGSDASPPGGAGSAGALAGARPGVGATHDGSASNAGSDGQWGALLRRIDAEDGIMPPDAVVMISATDLFSARRLAGGLDPAGRVVSATPGAGTDARAATGTIAGMEVPKVINLSIGVNPGPVLDVVAEFENEDQARHWESAWPSLHARINMNPYVILTGFGALVARAELTRAGTTIHLRETSTEAETMRLLQLVARFIGAQPVAAP